MVTEEARQARLQQKHERTAACRAEAARPAMVVCACATEWLA